MKGSFLLPIFTLISLISFIQNINQPYNAIHLRLSCVYEYKANLLDRKVVDKQSQVHDNGMLLAPLQCCMVVRFLTWCSISIIH